MVAEGGSIQIMLIHFLLVLLSTVAKANDEEINELFCELNDHAKDRVMANMNVFPCN